MALHFIGFKDDRYWKPDEHYVRAVAIFGKPDFCHIGWDARVSPDIAPGDKVVWANYGGDLADCLPPFFHHTFDDSRQDIIANRGEKGVDYV